MVLTTPRRTNRDDSSGGHFFQIPGGDLLRKTVMDELRAKNARLTVFVTDTCNVPALPELFGGVPARPVFAEPPIVTLLLRYRGIVDISGSSRGQYGWYNSRSGIFTQAFVRSIDQAGGTWSGLLDSAGQLTQLEYRSMKEAALSNPGNMDATTLDFLRNQQTQSPQAFQLDVMLERTGSAAN